MKILVACEESQRVCVELRKLGHDAYSCDLVQCSGGHPEWHIQGDVLHLIDGDCCFSTVDGLMHCINGRWDMIIAFPPCTYLTNAGTRHFSPRCNPPEKIEKRLALRKDAYDFFMKIANADCAKIAIENPVGFMNSSYRKADQVIHPYFFAESENDTKNYFQKRTCLWLKGLPLLQRTSNLPKPKALYFCNGEKCKGKPIHWCEGIRGTTGGQKGRSKERSKTFPGIAKSMAKQWAGEIKKEVENEKV